MTVEELVKESRERRASDIHICGDGNVYIRVDGVLNRIEEFKFESLSWVDELCALVPDYKEMLDKREDIDFCYTLPNTKLRHRVNVFYQQGTVEAVIRILNDTVLSLENLHMPEVITSLAEEPRGMILVTGPTGSGKSTTLAAMVNYINQHRKEHIITIEDPIEYVYEPGLSLIRQREVGVDVDSFAGALKSALREDPDVILVGEMRDYETISAAITAAETGHLVFSTLHTIGAVATIDRIIDVFPPQSQQQVRTQLASILKGVITQTLLPLSVGKGRIAATEIMVRTDAIANLIREDKVHQIDLDTNVKLGMHTLDRDLANLVNLGKVDKDAALEKCVNAKNLLGMI